MGDAVSAWALRFSVAFATSGVFELAPGVEAAAGVVADAGPELGEETDAWACANELFDGLMSEVEWPA